MSVFSRLAVILFIYGLKLYWFCLATDCRFVIWHCFRLRMFSLELHATFLISSYLLLMFSISIGIFYVNVGILTPCGYSVYLWTQVVLILPSYGLSLCYLTLFPVICYYSIGIFYGILTPCGYSVYLWTQAVLILPSYGLSLCYLTFLISSYLLLMFSISIGIFYVNAVCLTPYLRLFCC